MTIESAAAFRAEVNNNDQLQKSVAEVLKTGSIGDLVSLGEKSGHTFSESEAIELINGIEEEDELSEFELELISGGIQSLGVFVGSIKVREGPAC